MQTSTAPQPSAVVHDKCTQCQRALTDTSRPWCGRTCRSAYNTVAIARGDVCQQCNTNAKHPDFPFCGSDCKELYKVSAAARGDLCKNCNKHVKQPGFEFCSKTCGSQAAAAARQATQAQAQPQVPNTFGVAFSNGVRQGQSAPAPQGGRVPRQSAVNTAAGVNAAPQPQLTAQNVAHHNAQHNPQSVPVSMPAPVAAQNGANGTARPQGRSGRTQPVPAVLNVASRPNGSVPYATAPVQVAQIAPSPAASPAPGTANLTSKLKTALHIGKSPNDNSDDTDSDDAYDAYAKPPGTCLLTHCFAPVHVSGNKKSQYCTKSHAKAAIQVLNKTACIMCHMYPQDDQHYFCGDTCIDKSLFKEPVFKQQKPQKPQ